MQKPLTHQSLLLYLTCCLFWWSACQDTSTSAETTNSTQPVSLQFETTQYQKSFGNCSDSIPTGNCVQIKLTYPKAVGPQQSTAINVIIEGTLKKVFSFGEPVDDSISLAQISAQLIADYQQQQQEAGDYPIEYHIEVEGDTLWVTDQFASIHLPAYTFMGGAHPNTYVTLLNFDLQQGQLMDPQTFIADTTALKVIGEKAFFAAREGDGTSPDMYFWDGTYQLPENLSLTQEGLYFYYNPYEVAAYVFGPTEYTIPYNQLKNILHPQFLPTEEKTR